MGVLHELPVRAGKRGAVPDGALELAVERVRTVARYAGGHVQSAEVKLTAVRGHSPGWATLAQASLRARGQVIRAHAAGATAEEAIQRMGDRLRVQLERVTAPWPDRHRHPV